MAFLLVEFFNFCTLLFRHRPSLISPLRRLHPLLCLPLYNLPFTLSPYPFFPFSSPSRVQIPTPQTDWTVRTIGCKSLRPKPIGQCERFVRKLPITRLHQKKKKKKIEATGETLLYLGEKPW